jgi:hypothetical protein
VQGDDYESAIDCSTAPCSVLQDIFCLAEVDDRLVEELLGYALAAFPVQLVDLLE